MSLNRNRSIRRNNEPLLWGNGKEAFFAEDEGEECAWKRGTVRVSGNKFIKIGSWNLVVFIFGVMLLGGLPGWVLANEISTESLTQLSVEDTVLRAKRGDGPKRAKNYENQVQVYNPAALPDLYRILDDPAQKQDWAYVARFIGYIGDAEDVSKLLARLESLRGQSFSIREAGFPKALAYSVFFLERRQIPGAKEASDKILHYSFWRDLDLKIANLSPMHQMGDSPAFMTIGCFYSKAYSEDPDLERKLQSVVDEVQSPLIKETLSKHRRKALNVLRDNRILQAGGDLSEYYPNLYGKKPKKSTAEEAAKRADARAYMKALAGEGRMKAQPSEPARAALAREALAEYGKIVELLAQENYGALAARLADNGRPLLLGEENTAEARAKLLDAGKMTRSLALEKELVKDLGQRMARQETAIVESFVLPGKNTDAAYEDPKASADIIRVVIPFADATDLRTKHKKLLSERTEEAPTVDDEGNPAICMIWQGGQWFWNPFGW